jgi:hypothetical protein
MANTKVQINQSVSDRFFERYGEEIVYWSGRYRHSTKAHWYSLAFVLSSAIIYGAIKLTIWLFWLLLLPLVIVVVVIMQLYSHTLEISNKRLEIQSCGKLCTKYLQYIEYYEIINVKVELCGGDTGHLIFETNNIELPIIRSPRIPNISRIHKIVKDLMEGGRSYMEYMQKQGEFRD